MTTSARRAPSPATSAITVERVADARRRAAALEQSAARFIAGAMRSGDWSSAFP